MSDQETPVSPAAPAAANPTIANATQALAIKELGDTVAGVKKQVRSLWIAFAVLAVVTLVLAALTLAPGLRFGMMGGRGTFQRGQFGTNSPIQGGGTGGTQNGTPGGGQNGVPTTP